MIYFNVKYLFICLLICGSFLCKAQPLPKCVDATKRLFIKSDVEILFEEQNKTYSYIDSSRIECFKIWNAQIKDTLNSYFFEFEIYQSNNIYQKKDEQKMHFFVLGLTLESTNNNFSKDTFNFYIEIKKFKEGIYFIDVSKNNMDIIFVNCYMCRDTIAALNITPNR